MNNELSVDKEPRYHLSTSDKHVKGNPIIITFKLENLSNQDSMGSYLVYSFGRFKRRNL